MDNGLGFLVSLLGALGGAMGLAAIAAALIALDSDGKGRSSGRIAGALASLWRAAGEGGWGKAAACGIGLGVAFADRAVRVGFEDVDRTPAMGIVHLGLLFIVIPLAAMVNFAFGGSANLPLGYLAIAAAMAVLVVLGQARSRSGGAAVVNAGLSLFAFAGLMAVVPWYVVVSFSERISHENPGHAFLMSLLIAPFYYVAAYSLMLCLEAVVPGFGPLAAKRPAAVFARRFLAALPVAFLLVFTALLFAQWAVGFEAPVKPLRLLFAAIALTAFSLPASMAIYENAAGRGPASILIVTVIGGTVLSGLLGMALPVLAGTAGHGLSSIDALVNVLVGLDAGGAGLFLGRDFWLMHLPLLPVLGLLVMAANGVAAKAIATASARLLRRPLAAERPNLATSLLFAAWAIGFIAASKALTG